MSVTRLGSGSAAKRYVKKFRYPMLQESGVTSIGSASKGTPQGYDSRLSCCTTNIPARLVKLATGVLIEPP